MLNLNSTFIDNSMALRAAAIAEPLNVEMPNHRAASKSNQGRDNSQQAEERNSKLIYLNPSDFIPKSSDSPVYGTSLMNNYNTPMNTSKGHLSTASSSPNHYSNSSTSSRTSTSEDTESSASSDCPISNSSSEPSSSTYAIPPDSTGTQQQQQQQHNTESPYRVETTVLNGSIYQTLTRRGETSHRASMHRPNYLECIDKLIEDEPLQTLRSGFNQRNNQGNQPIYSNKMDLLTRNRYKIYEDHSQPVSSDLHRSNKNSVSFRVKSDNNNQRILSDLMRTGSKADTLGRPIPPSRTSSLQYRNRTMHPSASLFIYNKKHAANNCHSNSSSDGDESSAIMENPTSCPDESIYSAFSLRMSRLSSFNLGVQEPKQIVDQPDLLITKGEQFRIESFYKSIGSSVYASKCAADLYTTDLQCLIKLLDWQHQFNGVPVWVFNTGLNPKRPKGLSLVIADKSTGFASIRLNQISHINDLKWTKPGHLTLKIYPKNLGEHTFNSQDIKANLSRKKQKQSRIKQSITSDELVRNCHSTLNQSFNTYSDLMTKLELNKGDTSDREEKFVFAALRFSSEFECSKFYDFYRNLYVDSQNDELFNPHYSKQQQVMPKGKLNMMKVFLKKITKSSISSPVAFQHVNSLSMANEIRE